MKDQQEVFDFVKSCGVYYLATYDQGAGQPRVRPFGTFHQFEDKIYIQTGQKKDVSRQIMAHPKVEICALKGDEWIRIATTLVEDLRVEAQQSLLDSYPELKKMYTAGDGNTQVFYLTETTATISSFKAEPKTYRF